MSHKDITIATPDGAMGAYLASPTAPNGAGIVVIQEIFGVNACMRGIADGFAARGYIALVPDLFWRIESGVQLEPKVEAEMNRAYALMGQFDIGLGVKDIQAAITHLRGLAGGKIGAVGYCLGGLLAYLTAARTDIDASVDYYGVNIEKMLGEAANIKKPLMQHIAGKDQFVPAAAQKQVIEGLKNNPLITIYTYPEMEHAFARVGGSHYDHANAELANGRTATFFRQYLC